MRAKPAALLRVVCGLLLACSPRLASAQELNENCTISVLNRNVRVNADGSWVLPNIPANFGPVRARVTCIIDGLTVSGESEPFVVPANGSVDVPPIHFGQTTPIPTTVTIGAPTRTLTTVGATVQLSVVGHYAGGATQDLAAASAGTRYTISNSATATVSADGLVQALRSGTVLVQATNEGASGMIAIQIAFSNADGDGDGIPDEWEVAHGLNPNNALDAQEDPDHDGLTNLQEYHLGTDPHNRDTDGDGLSDGDEVNVYHTNPLLRDTDGDGIGDGLEVQAGTDPLDSGSSNLAAALASLRVTPDHFILTFNTIAGDVSRFLTVTGVMKDGATIDLTQTARGTNYASSDLTICNFGEDSGRIFAGTSGTCVITVTNSGASATVNGAVRTFTPTALSALPMPGFANAVAVNGTTAYVAAGEAGLQVVDVTDRVAPAIVASFDTPGNANDVKLAGSRAYVADGRAGLQIVDIANPLAPQLLGTLDTPGVAMALIVSGDLVYLAAADGGLQIIDAHVPSAPHLIAFLHLPSAANAVSLSGTIATVSTDYAGLQFIDVADVNHPVLVGSADLDDQTRGVVTRGTTAYVADYTTGMVMLDISDPTAPSFLSVVDQVGVGWLTGIAVADRYAAGSDTLFLGEVVIVDVQTPSNPIPRAMIDFRDRGTGFAGVGLTMDSNFVYLVEVQSDGSKGVSAPSQLVIGQYRGLEDQNDIPPTAAIVSPAADATFIAGEPIRIVVAAADDVAVASVDIRVDGATVFHDTSDPFEFSVIPPAGATSVTIGATATDLGNNSAAAADVHLNIVPDPLTSVRGRVLDANGQPLAGATAAIQTFSATTGTDGRFSFDGVATITPSVTVSASLRVNGVQIVGTSAARAPVRGDVTDVGDIIVSSAFVTDLGAVLACSGFCVDLPFDFSIGDNTYRQLAVERNGTVRFPGGDIIDVAQLNLLEVSQDPLSGVFVNASSPDHVVVTWNRMAKDPNCDCARPGPTAPRNTFQLILFADGLIQFGYRGMEQGYLTVGVFPSGASTFTAVDFGATPNVGMGEGEAVYETFDLAGNPFDLDGAIISFAPAAGGGYSAGVAADTTAPVCTVTSPASGAVVLEGQTVPVGANASDNSTVRRLRFESSIGGSPVDDGTAPYGASFVIPVGVAQVAFTVTAFDGAGNSGMCSATVAVIPDPLTTATGRVVDKSQAPLAGVSVIVVGQSATTAADGTFTVPGVRTVQPVVIANATLFEDGTGRILLTGSSAQVPPVRGGTTPLGDIVAAATAFETDLGTQIVCGFDCSTPVTLPFDFPLAGVPRNQITIEGREGFVRTDDGGYITPLCCAMDANPNDPASGLYVNDRLPGRFVVTWLRTLANDIEQQSNTVQLILFNDGRIQYGYGDLARGSYGIELIVPSNTFMFPLGADFSAGIPATIGPGQSVTESFSPVGHLLDLDNGFVVFTPRPEGGYDMRSVSDAAPPVCTVTSPANGATLFEGEPIQVQATVTPGGAPVGYLHFQSSDGSLSQDVYYPPYEVPFVVPMGAGPLALEVTAFDGWAHTGLCVATVNVVSGPAPTVTIVSPADGATLAAGATVSIRVQATSRVPVRRLDGSINGVPLLTRAVSIYEQAAPGDPQIGTFFFTVPSAPGSFTLRASATDSVGKTGTTGDVTLTVAADPRTTVQGTVVDLSSNPVQNAHVAVDVHGASLEVFNFSAALGEMPDLSAKTPDLVRVIPSLNLRNPGLLLGIDPFAFGSSPAHAARFTTTLHTDPGYYVFRLGVNQGGVLSINGFPYLTVTGGSGQLEEAETPPIRLVDGTAAIQILSFDNGNPEVQLSVAFDGSGVPPQVVSPGDLVPAFTPYAATTDGAGAFSIVNVPTTLGDIGAAATMIPVSGPALAGHAIPARAPIAGGTTAVGQIQLISSAPIFVSDPSGPAVLRIDERTGTQQLIGFAGSLHAPQGLAVLRSGRVAIVAPPGCCDGSAPGIVLLDPDAPFDRRQTLVSSGGLLQYPFAIAEEPGGTLIVTDSGRLIRIDVTRPSPGNQTVVANGVPSNLASGLAVEANGTIVVADPSTGLIRVDPLTGEQTPVPEAASCVDGVAIDAVGRLLFTSYPSCGDGGVFRLESDGTRTTLTSGGIATYPFAIASEADGHVLVIAYSYTQDGWLRLSVVRVDPQTGEQTLLSSGTFLNGPVAMAISPRR